MNQMEAIEIIGFITCQHHQIYYLNDEKDVQPHHILHHGELYHLMWTLNSIHQIVSLKNMEYIHH